MICTPMPPPFAYSATSVLPPRRYLYSYAQSRQPRFHSRSVSYSASIRAQVCSQTASSSSPSSDRSASRSGGVAVTSVPTLTSPPNA